MLQSFLSLVTKCPTLQRHSRSSIDVRMPYILSKIDPFWLSRTTVPYRNGSLQVTDSDQSLEASRHWASHDRNGPGTRMASYIVNIEGIEDFDMLSL